MPTGLKVALSKRAEKDLETILTYIRNDFGSASAVRFKNLIINFLDLISNFPEIGSLEVPDKNIRVFVAHKRLKIFYNLSDKRIVILRLFDTRQNPDKR
ncbi:type II toxin-antitoxin system RelE/ParE family toxin [Mucilaginibacter conchicola]|uniref:Type II toxin-antitoxin system RelE/ParE family toxin n=1 Tax=Mucilaginibacter conchicola TaxID=2303333 RepID=A0A372NYK6_9SPHI|nr:type II toxin-antitoxin system RelE/ParE family toxin [Mucilaginibacter conchicola]